jgi:integrase
VFPNPFDRPENITWLWAHHLRERIERAGYGKPHGGWHAFRRALATNLKALGVDDLTIQRILRHGDVTTTRQSYIQLTTADAAKGLKLLEEKFEEATRQLEVESLPATMTMTVQ